MCLCVHLCASNCSKCIYTYLETFDLSHYHLPLLLTQFFYPSYLPIYHPFSYPWCLFIHRNPLVSDFKIFINMCSDIHTFTGTGVLNVCGYMYACVCNWYDMHSCAGAFIWEYIHKCLWIYTYQYKCRGIGRDLVGGGNCFLRVLP